MRGPIRPDAPRESVRKRGREGPWEGNANLRETLFYTLGWTSLCGLPGTLSCGPCPLAIRRRIDTLGTGIAMGRRRERSVPR